MRVRICGTPSSHKLSTTSCDVIAATVRDSRRASGQNRFAQGGWSGCAGHGSSRPVRNALGAKQNLGDRAIAVALDAGIERAQRQCQSLSALRGEFMECGTRGAPIERAPKPPCGMRANLEIHVERQFGGVRRADEWRLSQPKPVLEPTNTQQNVPAIGGLPEFAGRHLGQTERISVGRGCALNNWNDCRQNFWCPEYGLILRRPRRVSHKSRGPISF